MPVLPSVNGRVVSVPKVRQHVETIGHFTRHSSQCLGGAGVTDVQFPYVSRGRALWPPIALVAEHGASYSLQRFRAHAVTSADVNADAKKSRGRHIRLPHLTLTRTDLSRGCLRYGRPVPSSPATTDLRLENRSWRRRACPETNISGGLKGDLTKGGVGTTTSGPFRLLLRSGRLIASEANCPRL